MLHALKAPITIDIDADPDPPQGVKRPLPALQAPLPPAAAAREFVGWMQDFGFVGERLWGGPDGLWEYYLWHCDDIRRHRLPDNVFAHALGGLVDCRQINDRTTGKRRRLTAYTIPDAETETIVATPQQLRRAA
jgi:hypothetical protein